MNGTTSWSTARDAWPRVAVVGAGSVGCFFGGLLARAGAEVTFIGRQQQVDALNRDGLEIDSAKFPSKLTVKASTGLDAVRDADLVMVCVKTLDLESTAQALASVIPEPAAVLCMQNGVDHAERFQRASGRSAIAAAVYVAVSLPAPGRVRHDGRGDLVIGASPLSEQVADSFRRAEVPCRVSANVDGELWAKLIVNCAYNAQSAIAQANYGTIVAVPQTRAVLIETVSEALAVARALGIELPNPDPLQAILELGTTTISQQFSSTAQDLARGRPTEIDWLNGHVVRRGAEVGVPTPVNATLHALVKLRELALKSPHPAR